MLNIILLCILNVNNLCLSRVLLSSSMQLRFVSCIFPFLGGIQKLLVVHSLWKVRTMGTSASRDWEQSQCLWLQFNWHQSLTSCLGSFVSESLVSDLNTILASGARCPLQGHIETNWADSGRSRPVESSTPLPVSVQSFLWRLLI